MTLLEPRPDAVHPKVAALPERACDLLRSPLRGETLLLMRRARRLVRNDGFTATVRVHGTTSYVADRGGRTPRVRRVLRYGQVWRSHGFRCTSRRAGITYRHGPGPGIG